MNTPTQNSKLQEKSTTPFLLCLSFHFLKRASRSSHKTPLALHISILNFPCFIEIPHKSLTDYQITP